MVARNGIPDATLVAVASEPGARLRWDAAASWERLCDDVARRYGWRPRLTSAGDGFRSYVIQERIFRQRYTNARVTGIGLKYWDSDRDGVREAWWRLPVWAAAATPGTSNHGWGVACDVTGLGGFKGTRYGQLAKVAGGHGWDNVEGRSIAEAWHWRYRPENDRHRGVSTVSNPGGVGGVNIPTPGGSLPGALTPEELTVAEVERILAALAEVDRKASLALGVETTKRDPREMTPEEQVRGALREIDRKASLGLGVETAARDPREQTPAEQVLDDLVAVPEVGGETTIRNAIVEGSVNARQGRAYLAHLEGNLRAAISAMSPQQIADTIPTELAGQVADELARRLTNGA